MNNAIPYNQDHEAIRARKVVCVIAPNTRLTAKGDKVGQNLQNPLNVKRVKGSLQARAQSCRDKAAKLQSAEKLPASLREYEKAIKTANKYKAKYNKRK